jgi:Flp pilus assembly protein TadD
MEHNLAVALYDEGRLDEAAAHFARVLQINPNDAESHNGLGNILQRQWRLGEAVDHFREAIRLRPDHAGAHNNLGSPAEQRRKDEAAGVSERWA